MNDRTVPRRLCSENAQLGQSLNLQCHRISATTKVEVSAEPEIEDVRIGVRTNLGWRTVT